jgi:RimJ/RimL family protein N-acetyltransferase
MASMTGPPSEVAITFRPLTSDDFDRLRRWLTVAHVRHWWRDEPTTAEAIAQMYAPLLAEDSSTKVFIINVDGGPIGLIQCYRHRDDPNWERAVGVPNAAGIDYLIGEAEWCGRGIGSRAIRLFCPRVLDLYPDVATVASVPQRDNRASCRALEKAGFRLVREADLESDDPSDSGVSAIYVLPRRT